MILRKGKEDESIHRVMVEKFLSIIVQDTVWKHLNDPPRFISLQDSSILRLEFCRPF